MSRRITVRCDGPHCSSTSRPLALANQDGWQLGDVDLCPWCLKGDRCNGEVGPYDCSCMLPYAHEGTCKCKHDLEPNA